MELFTYLLTGIIAFIGLFIGLLITKYSLDEVNSFKKYIPFLQMMLIMLGFLVMFIYINFTLASVIFILSFAFIFLFWKKRDINTLDYVIFSILFFIASYNINAHYYMTAIIFVFGILSGTLFFVLHTYPKKHVKNHGHHKHSGKNLDFDELSKELFNKYFFFLILIIINYIIGFIFTLIL